ncbi:MAG: hypothetical protein IPM29_18805 [Planctomycetes bacterium]|nr:hypothetical protein [Planctomycetota bacterium]
MLAAHLLMTLAAALLAQDPTDWVAAGRDPARPDAVVVAGRVELEPGNADAAALRSAKEQLRWDLESDVDRLIAERAPVWLPGFVQRREAARWLADLDARSLVQVLDQRRLEHDHGSFRSFQTHLLVRYERDRVDAELGRLARRIDTVARRFVHRGLGAIGLTGLLGFLWLWFDRLTRGYMTWRLGLLFGGMAVLGTGIALVSV